MVGLADIRKAIIDYVNTQVKVGMSELVPANGNTIIPNEEFSLTITAKNATNTEGGIQLKNLIWKVWVDDPNTGKLYVPSGRQYIAKSGLEIPGTVPPITLDPGALVNEMYLINKSDKTLTVGDTDTIALKGKAGNVTNSASTTVKYKLIADIDLDWLIPARQDTRQSSQPLNVVT